MAKFLNTSGVTYHLEELINNASEKLVLISPYLDINTKVKQLIEDKNRLKVDIRIVYGKKKEQIKNKDLSWLLALDYVRVSFCENLHAKCYLSETQSIITSLNLYEFSQVNNNEMGVLIIRDEDEKLYADNYDEVQRIIRVSDDLLPSKNENKLVTKKNENDFEKLTTSKLAIKLGLKSAKDLNDKLAKIGYIERLEDGFELTELGKINGGEEKSGRYGKYCIWNNDMTV